MEIYISTSEEHAPHKTHHAHPAEASAILFQVFLVFCRIYVHDSKEYEQELKKLLPAFIDYADRMLRIRGADSTKKLLVKMYEDAANTLPTSIKSVHINPKFASLPKSVNLDDAGQHYKIQKDLIAYGEAFIDHVIEGKASNVDAVIDALHRLASAGKRL